MPNSKSIEIKPLDTGQVENEWNRFFHCEALNRMNDEWWMAAAALKLITLSLVPLILQKIPLLGQQRWTEIIKVIGFAWEEEKWLSLTFQTIFCSALLRSLTALFLDLDGIRTLDLDQILSDLWLNCLSVRWWGPGFDSVKYKDHSRINLQQHLSSGC